MSDVATIDPETGEVVADDGTQVDSWLVPLDIASLDEESLLRMFPTPVQAAGALIIARDRLRKAPGYLKQARAAVRTARRELIIAKGYARQRADGRSVEERKAIAEADPEVIKAYEHLDTCELASEYAVDLKWALSKEIDILRSLNSNFREEHK